MAVVFDVLIALGLRRKLMAPTGAIITGLLVADVLSTTTATVVVMLTVVIALASKHVFKRGRKPIFNPAALGLAISLIGSSTAQSWWAGMPLLPPWHLLLLLALGATVSLRTKKSMQVLTFLGTYFLALWVMAVFHWGLTAAAPADALRPPFVNAALFLGFFMLTDPPTTPAVTGDQVRFSVLVAVVSVTMFWRVGGLAYLLVGLLTGNLWTVWRAWRRKSTTGLKLPQKSHFLARL
jgi:Na+-translocating ferredoxin:NAD+ oxidoreductase RnfD subunit